MNLLRWFTTPDTPSTNRENFRNVQIDAIGIGLSSAAATFLPVFLTRLNATSLQVGLLTSMPAATGLVLALAVGGFLQSRKNVVPWFSLARLLVITSYALTGLVTLILPAEARVTATLAIWAAATLPQTVVAIAFSVVMNAVAGPKGRYELMSRRWSILGFTTAITVFAIGQVLVVLPFPLNYQVVFMGLSVGGLISYYFSSHIRIPDNEPNLTQAGLKPWQRFWQNARQVLQEKPFMSFNLKRLVYFTGTTLAAPLLPLYYVREVRATDAWIGTFSMAQTVTLIFGYFLWMWQSRQGRSRRVLLISTLALSIYPALVSSTHDVVAIAIFAGMVGVFQAGIDLVFFDELMKTVPTKYSATFVAFAQSLQYLSSIIAPVIGTYLADTVGLANGLLVSAALRFVGFLLFLLGHPSANETES